MSDKILVTGASGHLAQCVIHHLLHTLHMPASQIIATTRSPDKQKTLSDQGIEVRAADFDVPGSLDAAFTGASRMLLISTDAFDRPGRRLNQHKEAISAAERTGLAHVVYTSMPDPATSKFLVAGDHLGTEQALADSRLPGWTVLRNHWYFEILLRSIPTVLAKGGNWFSAAGQGRAANIARDDLALAAATVVAGNETSKSIYTLSGEEALTREEQAQILSTVLGRPINVVHVPAPALVDGMVRNGLPAPRAEILASSDINTEHGNMGHISKDFITLTGKHPQSFADWVKANKAALSAF